MKVEYRGFYFYLGWDGLMIDMDIHLRKKWYCGSIHFTLFRFTDEDLGIEETS